MAVTVANSALSGAVALERWTETGTANTQLVTGTTTTDAYVRKLVWVGVKYSAAASVTAVVSLDSGAGAAFDHVLASMVISAGTDGIYIPDEDLEILETDAIVVTCPAGGVGITASVSIYTEVR